jgi:DNA-binding NtrC family response regulator
MTPHPTHDVLLVDPDEDVRAQLMLFLRLHGCRVIGTRGSDDTLQHLRYGFRPCVVVTDPRAIGAGGWDLVDFLREDSVLARVPLVLATVDPMQLKCAHWRGVRECIAKPVPPARYVDAVERQCRRRWRRLERIFEPAAVAKRAAVTEPAALAPGPVTPLLRRHHAHAREFDDVATGVDVGARAVVGARRR